MGLLDRFTSSDNSSSEQTPDKYRLLITAGPSYDTSKHQIVPVNGNDAVTISNEFITAKVKVRVRGYRGLPSGSPASSVYFDDPIHEKDQYSLAFSFVPKQDLPSVDTVWGNDFDHPIRDRLPPGFNTAFKIVKEFIDPGLACDAYADEPWLYGPSLSCWFAFHIGDKVSEDDFPAPDDENVLRDGADGSGSKIRQELGIPENNEKRRKFYLNATNRESLVFEKDRLYQADFYNPYLDFGNLALKLPGFSLKVYKYIDAKSHCLRYVFKNRATGDMYLNVNFNLLWGEGLEKALAEEKEPTEARLGRSGTTFAETASKDKSKQLPDVGLVAKPTKDMSNDDGKQPPVQPNHAFVQDSFSTNDDDKQPPVESDYAPVKDSCSKPVKVIPSPSWVRQPATPQSQQIPHGQETDDTVDEISRMLADTSTSDKRGQKTSILD